MNLLIASARSLQMVVALSFVMVVATVELLTAAVLVKVVLCLAINILEVVVRSVEIKYHSYTHVCT